MRTTTWLLTPMFALTLAACGDDKSDTDTDATTTAPATTGATDPMTTNPTESPTTEPAMSTTTTTTTTTEPATSTSTTQEPTTDPGTGTDPGTSSDTGTTVDVTGDPVELSCENYCALYESGCDDFKEYANTEDCMSQCAQWPVGLVGETAGDSLGCRTYHVGVANMIDADVHCPHAGPSGAGTCVAADAPKCEDYCTTYFGSCKDKLNLYKDMADCTTQCAPWYPGTAGQTAGDTIGCREYHAGVALGDPNTHCPHAGPGGADVCVVAP